MPHPVVSFEPGAKISCRQGTVEIPIDPPIAIFIEVLVPYVALASTWIPESFTGAIDVRGGHVGLTSDSTGSCVSGRSNRVVVGLGNARGRRVHLSQGWGPVESGRVGIV